MTKADLVNEIAKKTGTASQEVLLTLESFIEVIKDSMEGGNDIFIRGFGCFIIKKRAKKIARDLSRNTEVVVPEHFIPAFKPYPEFKEQVKNGKLKPSEKQA
jgi:DNA-binding protein HU-beta